MAIRDKVKQYWIRGMSAVGSGAARIASSTRHKVDEVTLQTRRKEVLGDLATDTYALWLKGEKMPPPLTGKLEELQRLDNELSELRASRYTDDVTPSPADPEEQTAGEQEESGTAPDATETLENPEPPAEEENAGTEPVTEPEQPVPVPVYPDSPVENEINGYFDELSSVGKMAEKVNSTLEQMSERLRSFPVPEEEQDGTKPGGEAPAGEQP